MRERNASVVNECLLLFVAVKPEYVKITREGNELQNASLIGPFSEGDDLALTCESGGGKPTPPWPGTTARPNSAVRAKEQRPKR